MIERSSQCCSSNRLHRRAPGLAGGCEYLLKTGQENIERVADHLILVFHDRRLEDVFAYAVVEDSALKHPCDLKFGGRRLALLRQPRFVAAFTDDRRQYLVLDHADVPAVDIKSLQAGIEVDAKPFAGENDIGIRRVKLAQPIAQRPGSVGEQLLPAGIERLEINRAIDLLDQIVLAGEVSIEQR